MRFLRVSTHPPLLNDHSLGKVSAWATSPNWESLLCEELIRQVNVFSPNLTLGTTIPTTSCSTMTSAVQA